VHLRRNLRPWLHRRDRHRPGLLPGARLP
jgi:hypothetical protein